MEHHIWQHHGSVMGFIIHTFPLLMGFSTINHLFLGLSGYPIDGNPPVTPQSPSSVGAHHARPPTLLCRQLRRRPSLAQKNHGFCRVFHHQNMGILSIKNGELPSGKHTNNYGKIHHFEWENQLFQWSCSIAFCMFTRQGKHLKIGMTKNLVLLVSLGFFPNIASFGTVLLHRCLVIFP